eukprot:jgi/Ulvmu1/5257/UM022_0051.1
MRSSCYVYRTTDAMSRPHIPEIDPMASSGISTVTVMPWHASFGCTSYETVGTYQCVHRLQCASLERGPSSWPLLIAVPRSSGSCKAVLWPVHSAATASLCRTISQFSVEHMGAIDRGAKKPHNACADDCCFLLLLVLTKWSNLAWLAQRWAWSNKMQHHSSKDTAGDTRYHPLLSLQATACSQKANVTTEHMFIPDCLHTHRCGNGLNTDATGQ